MEPPVARKLAVGHLCVRQLVFWLLVVSSFYYFKVYARSASMLLLLHSAFMLRDRALNSHGNYIVDHGKSWKNHGIVFWNFCGNPDDDIENSGAECVICISDMRDTLILPCRHLCLYRTCKSQVL